MKKEEIASYITYAIMFVIILLVGFIVIQPNSANIVASLDGKINIWIFTLICIVIGILLNIIFIELGHVIGAKLGGYKVLSINFAGLCFYKVTENEKLVTKVGFKTFDGLSGETIIYPNKEKTRPMFYVIFPFILFIIEIVGLVLAYSLIKDSSSLAFIKYAMVIIATIGGIMYIYDFIPFKLDTNNDGYRYTLLVKAINKEAFNEKLKIEGDLLLNKENKEYKIFEEITDFSATVNMYSLYNLLEDKKYEEANKIVDDILKIEKLSNDTKISASTWKIFILLKEEKLEEAKKFFEGLDELTMKSIKNGYDMNTYRTYLYYVMKVENTYSLFNEIISKYNKLYRSSLSAFKEKDKKMFDDIVNAVSKEDKKEAQ